MLRVVSKKKLYYVKIIGECSYQLIHDKIVLALLQCSAAEAEC